MEYVDPEETEINDEKQTLSNLILALLEEKDMSVKEISDVLQANPGSVRTILNRLKNKGSVTVIPSGEWSLNREEVGF